MPTQRTSVTPARLLEAIEPLADALRPPVPPLVAPGVVCAPESLVLDPYLRILRRLLDDGEALRVLGFADQLDALGPVSAIFSGAKEKFAAARDKTAANTLVAITDRRVITARTSAFLEQAEIRADISIDQVRYVRAAATQNKGTRLSVDLITRDANICWLDARPSHPIFLAPLHNAFQFHPRAAPVSLGAWPASASTPGASRTGATRITRCC
ncbi:hypothetical protein ABZ371_01765 [Streptomyces sp. NPDC005899]|uniref:hypothetical protein n=1 Tax=Streptomyces sp. NPDC005899 TaxID=3155716 RepID=UPI003403E241